MSGKKGVRVIILGEDQRQVSFARRVLMNLRFSSHEISKAPVPNGDGSGAQWVQTEYPRQVAVNRSKRSHQQCTLLVSIDRDDQTVLARKQQFDEILRSKQMSPRSNDEPVAIWVPSRNIETWISHFTGQDVDETEDYKSRTRRIDLKDVAEGFVKEFHAWKQSPQTFTTLSSLSDAYEELSRIVL